MARPPNPNKTRSRKPDPAAGAPVDRSIDRELNWDHPRHLPAGEVLAFPQMGPLMGITHRRTVVVRLGDEDRTFVVVVYAAYNARGLIGPEMNGVAVLDQDNRSVLLDRHARQPSGYFGPTQHQIDEWKRVCGMTADQFRAFVNAHPEARYEI